MRARHALATAIFAAAALAPAALAAELGTLFHSPQERDRLDRLRRGEAVNDVEGEATVSLPRVNGFMRRSDGRDTVFLDGRAYPVPVPKSAVPEPGKPAAPAGAIHRAEPKPKG